MTKSEIVKEISARTSIDGKAVLAVVEGFMNEVKTSLGKEENVYLRGFGSFIVKKRAQKIARNISKNTAMIIPAHNIPAFKPSDEFLKMVKQQKHNERNYLCFYKDRYFYFVFNTPHSEFLLVGLLYYYIKKATGIPIAFSFILRLCLFLQTEFRFTVNPLSASKVREVTNAPPRAIDISDKAEIALHAAAS